MLKPKRLKVGIEKSVANNPLLIDEEWWRPLKVRVFIMQLIGWIEFGIRPDSVQPILLLIVRGYTSRCIL